MAELSRPKDGILDANIQMIDINKVLAFSVLQSTLRIKKKM